MDEDEGEDNEKDVSPMGPDRGSFDQSALLRGHKLKGITMDLRKLLQYRNGFPSFEVMTAIARALLQKETEQRAFVYFGAELKTRTRGL